MSNCRTTQIGEVCYTDAAGVSSTLFASFVYDVDGVKIATIYTNAAGDPVDTTGGTVTVGRCTCPQTFVEQGCWTVTAQNAVLPGTFDTYTFDLTVLTHLHWIYNAVNGFGYPGAAPIPGNNPSPIDLTNVAAVQAVLDAAFGPGVMGYYAASPVGIFYALNATAAGTYPSAFWLGDAANYTVKDSLNAFDPVPGPITTELQQIEVVKTIACDGTVSVKLYERGGKPIDPQPLNNEWTLGACQTAWDNRPVCVKQAGGSVVEGWAFYGRDPYTGNILHFFLEDAKGQPLTGDIVECPCESVTPPPNYPLVTRDIYGQASFVAGKWQPPNVTDCGPYSWTADVWVDGVIVFSVPSTPIPSQAAALTFLNTTLAGYFGATPKASNPARYEITMIDPAVHQEMVVITETASGPLCSNVLHYSWINWDATGWGPPGFWDEFNNGAPPTPATASGFGYRGPQ